MKQDVFVIISAFWLENTNVSLCYYSLDYGATKKIFSRING